jgi:hypothetical protein
MADSHCECRFSACTEAFCVDSVDDSNEATSPASRERQSSASLFAQKAFPMLILILNELNELPSPIRSFHIQADSLTRAPSAVQEDHFGLLLVLPQFLSDASQGFSAVSQKSSELRWMQSGALARRVGVLPTQQLDKLAFAVQLPLMSHGCAFRSFQTILTVVVQESQHCLHWKVR